MGHRLQSERLQRARHLVARIERLRHDSQPDAASSIRFVRGDTLKTRRRIGVEQPVTIQIPATDALDPTHIVDAGNPNTEFQDAFLQAAFPIPSSPTGKAPARGSNQPYPAQANPRCPQNSPEFLSMRQDAESGQQCIASHLARRQDRRPGSGQ